MQIYDSFKIFFAYNLNSTGAFLCTNVFKVSLGWNFAYWINDCLFEKISLPIQTEKKFFHFISFQYFKSYFKSKDFLNWLICKVTVLACLWYGVLMWATLGPEFIQVSTHREPLPVQGWFSLALKCWCFISLCCCIQGWRQVLRYSTEMMLCNFINIYVFPRRRKIQIIAVLYLWVLSCSYTSIKFHFQCEIKMCSATLQ